MRLSTEASDPGNEAFAALVDEKAYDVRVFLDGKDVTHRCVTADDDAGYALLQPEPFAEDGSVLRYAWDVGLEPHYGRVRIIIIATEPARY